MNLDQLSSVDCLQGMGGTLASVANVLAIAVAKTALDQGFGYFLTALIVVIIALIGYLYLPLLVSTPRSKAE